MKQFHYLSLGAICLAMTGCGSDEAANQLGSVSVTGTAKEGETLTATVSDPDGVEQSTLRYQWVVDGAAIDGATSSTYTLTVNEANERVYVSVVYTDSRGFQESHTSDLTDVVEALPINFPGTLTIAGAATVNETLEAVIVDDNGVMGAVTYQWMADGVAIDGATSSSYALTNANLGQAISVSASYTDDEGFAESLVSDATAAVQSDAVNTVATLTIDNSDTLVVGDVITANLVDPNGTSNAVFVWTADGSVIDGQSTASFTLDASHVGLTLAVSTDYTDDNGYEESVSAEASGVVHSAVVNSLAELATASASLEAGAVVGLNAGDYDSSDVATNEINIAADNVRLVKVNDADVVFSGNLCIQVSGSGSTISGFAFEDINLLTDSACAGNGPSAIYLSGDNITFSENTITNEAASHGLDDFSWIGVKGLNNTITRNAFTDATGQKVVTKGGVITIYNNSTADDQEGHTISYNLFKDFGPGSENDSRNSSAYMIQVGRSTGSSSQEDGLNTIEFNLFTNVNLDRRYMRVQSGENTIRNNTFLDGSGMIALEDGNNNTVTNNIFINTIGDNPDDGGVSYGPYGHTITNNYIAGLRTTSGDRGGLYANSDVLDNSGNSSGTPAVVTVANNTILNSREAIEFASKECQDADNPVAFLVDFDNNLVANGETGALTGNESNGAGREAIQDDCAIDPSSDFDGNHIYSAVLTNSGGAFFELYTGAADNVVGAEAGADIVADTNGLWMGQNADAGKGADTSQLILLTEADVGPGSGE